MIAASRVAVQDPNSMQQGMNPGMNQAMNQGINMNPGMNMNQGMNPGMYPGVESGGTPTPAPPQGARGTAFRGRGQNMGNVRGARGGFMGRGRGANHSGLAASASAHLMMH
jgi:hypothetical protein